MEVDWQAIRQEYPGANWIAWDFGGECYAYRTKPLLGGPTGRRYLVDDCDWHRVFVGKCPGQWDQVVLSAPSTLEEERKQSESTQPENDMTTRLDKLSEEGGMALNVHLKKEAAKACRKLLRQTGETKTALVSRLLVEAAKCHG